MSKQTAAVEVKEYEKSFGNFGNVEVKVRSFKGKFYVDIRKQQLIGNKYYPSKKGIMFPITKVLRSEQREQ